MTSQVQTMYSPGPDNGFILRDSAESAGASQEQRFQPREGTPDTQDPSLYVAWN